MPGFTHVPGLIQFMPRKRITQFSKPSTPTHPSLTSSGKKESICQLQPTTAGTSNSSVNDLIQHLRRSRISSKVSEQPAHETNPHTVHPSLNAFLDIPNTPIPRPRFGMRVSGGRRVRGPAGPPPPDSWLSTSTRSSTNARSNRGMAPKHADRPILRFIGSLPDLHLPHKGSLLHLALKGLAQGWDFHRVYDQFYLATLPVRHKEAILSYIAFYNPQGIDCQGLEVLFLDDTELVDATGSDSLSHLDLASSLGYGIEAKDLKTVLANPRIESKSKDTLSQTDIPDSWDSPPLQSTALRTPTLRPRFPALTHLSLSNPANPSWKYLLAVTPYLATLTHLSLAYWPTPSLTPNSTTAYRETPSGSVDYGGSNFYSVFDGDLSEAANVLRRLSKATYCLQWLDLTGCSDWVQALGRMAGPDWCGGWRGVETVKAGQGWIPTCLEEEGSDWRRVAEASTKGKQEASALWAMKKELVAWANVEKHIGNVERLVKSTVASKTSNRSKTVRFERGWEGWWIEDALRYFTLMDSNSVSMF